MKKVIILALATFCFASCKKDAVPYPPTLGAATVTVSRDAQTVNIPIESEMEILEITMPDAAKEWCNFEWTQSGIIATVTFNSLVPREVTFTLKGTQRNGSATLQQSGRKMEDFRQYDMSTWKVSSFSDQIVSDGGGAAAILDLNNPHSTFWHSDWSIGAPLPHWIVIDMNQEVTIDMIQLGWRQYGTRFYHYNKVTEVYVGNSSEPAGLTQKVGSLTTLAPYGASSDQYAPYDNVGLSANSGRYLKLVVPESNNGSNSIIAYVKAFKYEGTD